MGSLKAPSLYIPVTGPMESWLIPPYFLPNLEMLWRGVLGCAFPGKRHRKGVGCPANSLEEELAEINDWFLASVFNFLPYFLPTINFSGKPLLPTGWTLYSWSTDVGGNLLWCDIRQILHPWIPLVKGKGKKIPLLYECCKEIVHVKCLMNYKMPHKMKVDLCR